MTFVRIIFHSVLSVALVGVVGWNSLNAEAAPSWEENASQGKEWTEYTRQLLQEYGESLQASFEDKGAFCPNFDALTKEQKENFWITLISELSYHESGHKPTDRYNEAEQGIDDITGNPVYSEGLLALSYQDQQRYPFCAVFDWQRDKDLDPNDAERTIFSPRNNLFCGVRIFIDQVRNYGNVATNTGYWSVLRPNNSHSKVDEISSATRSLSFCQGGTDGNTGGSEDVNDG